MQSIVTVEIFGDDGNALSAWGISKGSSVRIDKIDSL